MIFFSKSNIPLLFLKLSHFPFLLIIIYWAETYWLQKKNHKILLFATEKTGYEVNAEKPERMFITFEGNIRRISYHKIGNTSF